MRAAPVRGSFVSELRRRNVIRFAGLYLVAGWLIVQVAETLLPIFGTPGWVLKTLVVLLALGFVPALVFSWVFELTPEGLKRDRDVPAGSSISAQTARRMDRMLAVGMVVVVALIAADRLWPEPAPAPVAAAGPADAATAAAPATTPRPSPRSIAVLPFVNMSADADNEYFSDGISEELLNALVRVEGLQVASRTSSFAYKGRTDTGVARIAQELNVAHVLEGSVRKAGNRVRITAQLIDAGNDRHLWSETYDRELVDIFAIQDEIAKAIVLALRDELGGPEAPAVSIEADTTNMQAYDVYLKARELFIARRELPEAVRLFERAIELDPRFARAYEGLAAVSVVITSWGYDDRDYHAMVEPAAARALELDPTLSTPWAARAMARKAHRPVDYAAVMADMEKAIAADPRNATAVFWRGIAWTELGFFDRAIADYDRCLALEPGYHNCRSHKAMTLVMAGDEAAGLAEFERTVADGAYLSRVDHFVLPLLRRGDRTLALMTLDRNDLHPDLRAAVIAALDTPGRRDPRAAEVVARHYAWATSAEAKTVAPTRLFLWLGDLDAVVAADDDASDQIIAWERDPPAFPNSPQMKRKLADLGVVAYWRAHGFPPHCQPRGDDFHCD